MTRSDVVRLVPLLIMLLLSIVLASGLFRDDRKLFEDSPLVGLTITPFSIPSLGAGNTLFAPRDWRGKVVVLNIFASWCVPCVEEHKIWMDVAKKTNINLYGMAWKDTPVKISEWLNKHGNPYRLIGIDEHGTTSISLAITGIPETMVLDQNGSIYFHYQAPVTRDLVDNVIVPLAEKLASGEIVAKPRVEFFGQNVSQPNPDAQATDNAQPAPIQNQQQNQENVAPAPANAQ
jgi:cytochrome c biogenesis protein CcmG/thiol:disulfide interchange protein DsbE